jgi:hypothetical protein
LLLNLRARQRKSGRVPPCPKHLCIAGATHAAAWRRPVAVVDWQLPCGAARIGSSR